MSLFKCENSVGCSVFAVISSVIIGIIAAILQGTGVITTEPYFLYGAVIFALAYLAVLLITVSFNTNVAECARKFISLIIAGALGTILVSGVLLAAVSPVSLLGTILVGVLVFFISLTLVSVGCYIKCLSNR